MECLHKTEKYHFFWNIERVFPEQIKWFSYPTVMFVRSRPLKFGDCDSSCRLLIINVRKRGLKSESFSLHRPLTCSLQLNLSHVPTGLACTQLGPLPLLVSVGVITSVHVFSWAHEQKVQYTMYKCNYLTITSSPRPSLCAVSMQHLTRVQILWGSVVLVN